MNKKNMRLFFKIFIIIFIAILPGCSSFDWIKEKLSIATPKTKPIISAQVPNTYKGIPINPDSVYILSSEYSPISSQARLTLDEWIKNDDHKDMLKQLLHFQFKNSEDFKKKYSQDNHHLSKAGIHNNSNANYIFKLPGLDYYIKIAGPINRAQSALMERGIWPGQQPSKAILDEILSGRIKTYQTASRAAYFLILQELKRMQNLEHVVIPDTHLIYFPGYTGTPNDDNVIIVQKALPHNIKKLTSGQLKNISHDILEELVYAIIGAGLWSIKENIFIDNAGKMLYVVDLEQPNNSAPKDFFHKDPVRYYGNINAGIEHILDMLHGDTKKLKFVRELVEHHPVVQSPDYHARYKKELIDMLNKKVPV